MRLSLAPPTHVLCCRFSSVVRGSSLWAAAFSYLKKGQGHRSKLTGIVRKGLTSWKDADAMAAGTSVTSLTLKFPENTMDSNACSSRARDQL